jgi:putative membrane protein
LARNKAGVGPGNSSEIIGRARPAPMLWIKAFHVVAVISWMAGLLYIWRLYVYHAMTEHQLVRDQLAVMERKLLRAITTPAAIASLITGIAMLVMAPALLKQPWMHIKLTLVLGMLGSHVAALRYRHKLLENPQASTHKRFRVLNELPTLLMIGIVIMVIVRPCAR